MNILLLTIVSECHQDTRRLFLCFNVPVCHHYTLASVLLPHKENVKTAQWSVNMSNTKRKGTYVRLRISIHVYKQGTRPLDHVHGLLLPGEVSLRLYDNG